MPDNPRIDELRRRVDSDPTSIAFAQLAEEYRRAGSYGDAIQTCRAGLMRHPGYLSARVTLGRSLIEIGQLDEAESELSHVLRTAPENLAAIRGMAEIHHRRGDLPEALQTYRSALQLARYDPDLERTVQEIERYLQPKTRSVPGGMSYEQARDEFLLALDVPASAPAPVPATPPAPVSVAAPEPPAPRAAAPVAQPLAPPASAARAVVVPPARKRSPAEPVELRALPELERWLDAIVQDRESRAP